MIQLLSVAMGAAIESALDRSLFFILSTFRPQSPNSHFSQSVPDLCQESKYMADPEQPSLPPSRELVVATSVGEERFSTGTCCQAGRSAGLTADRL